MKIKPRNIIFNFLAIITVLAAVFVCFNIFSGAKGYSVITDSMSPSINKGDVVFVKKADFGSLNEGDVVTVRFADGSGYFTHRITKIDHEFGMFRTKGDANQSEDPQPSQAEQIVGKLWYSVPLLGYASIAFNELGTVKISVILAIVVILLIAVTAAVEKIKKSKVRGDSNE